MPKKNQVPTLVDLALCSIGEFVTTYGRCMTKIICITSETNPEYGDTKLRSMSEFMKDLCTSCIPRQLHDKMSIAVLTAIRNLFNENRLTYNYNFALTAADNFLSERTVALQLIEVAVGAHLKAIKFSVWPQIMQDLLYNKLYHMVGLEILDLGSWSYRWSSDIEKTIASGVSAMPNLVCFILHNDCTDNIVLALAQNCKKLQKLDVTYSTCVTECSVGPLLSCKHLRCINLDETSMTIRGYANLFLQHLKIEDIGICDSFGDVLEHIRQKDIGIKSYFRIRTLETETISMEHLYLLIDMCPYITKLSLECDHSIGDLTILACLDYLKELKLSSCNFYSHGVKTLLEIKGCAIISLHLECVQEIDLNALILISQYCPDIRNLVFYCCKFLEHAALYPRKLTVRPFQFLERIECVRDCGNTHLEFLLSHCINIKFIQLNHTTAFGDDTMRRILLQNSMSKLEELKILFNHGLSMETVQLLMQNCDNLRRLSELETWRGISSEELNIFREDLKTTNTNLDTSRHN